MKRIQNIYNQHEYSIAPTIQQLEGEMRQQKFHQTVKEQITIHQKVEKTGESNLDFAKCTGAVINIPLPQKIPEKKIGKKLNTLTIILLTMSVSMLFSAVIGFGTYFIVTRESGMIRTRQTSNGIADPSNPNRKAQLSLQTPINVNWVYFDEPILVDKFQFQSLKENIVSYKKIIPTELKAKEIKLVIFYTPGHSGDGSIYEFWVKTRTIIENVSTAHFSFGKGYPQDSISSNSEQFTLPCSQNSEFRFRSNMVQISGELSYYIVGYKL